MIYQPIEAQDMYDSFDGFLVLSVASLLHVLYMENFYGKYQIILSFLIEDIDNHLTQ